jgi:type I restriction enzyme, R subunit
LIDAKAEDMLGHYLTTVLPGGFKAQVVAATRRAAVRYAAALEAARDRLLQRTRRTRAPRSTGFWLPGR